MIYAHWLSKCGVVTNAAAALFVGGAAADLHSAARLAEESIDSGAAINKLEQLAEATNI